MAVGISGTYAGNLKMDITHEPSGAVIRTAAPVDNQGDGSSFSPTDLTAAALGSCMITTMAIVAAREGIPFESAAFQLEKHMRSGPRRIDRIPVTIRLSRELTPEQRNRMEEVALSCPVHLSLLEAIEREVEFVYE
jgi:putative redox protein